MDLKIIRWIKLLFVLISFFLASASVLFAEGNMQSDPMADWEEILGSGGGVFLFGCLGGRLFLRARYFFWKVLDNSEDGL